MAIRLLVTGGTFDKEYDLINGKLYFNDTNVNEILERGRNTTEVHVRTLMMVDSLEMTDEDRDLIVSQCIKCDEDKIIITHGTDTMVQTALQIQKENIDKTIVLTGAMIPYTFGSSDGLYNMGSAMAFVQTLPVGVYIAMNGRYFKAAEVQKNRKTGYFESI
ncbi:MAG: asparaginase [Chitinophagaceae bacterium]|nr:asparaginase [Chitinophagaceae bacterium]